jgi:uncharacterized protein YyaL (SSP411 family)
MEHRFTNQLHGSSSVYLQQHAHNPVDWYPWSEDAFEKARQENKPVLLSIGYAACHWCHVMERESFEDEQVASFMNEHFINIKIDREERPDLDHIYMDAVQSITGSGGWPLNVFCTPDKKPFFGGTYFPPRRAYNRISWIELLNNIQLAWKNDPAAIQGQAENLTSHLISVQNKLTGTSFSAIQPGDVETILHKILQSADTVSGGFGTAPKFPHTMTIRSLYAYAHFYGDKAALAHANLSLRKLVEGGIYDHLGGGMARYSTDNEWLVPHFEKMLYDNALLLMALSDGARFTGDPAFLQAIEKTANFILEEMLSPEGGYYSAIDADSEGEEGRYYVWKWEELNNLPNDIAPIYCDWFGLSENGNWEGDNILHIARDKNSFLEKWNIGVEQFDALIDKCNAILLNERQKRISPIKDDKILLGWNALLISAFCACFRATGKGLYKENAIDLFDFIYSKFNTQAGWKHSFKSGVAEHPAFLDDFAFLIESCIQLQEVTGNSGYLSKAEQLIGHVLMNFERINRLFSFTSKQQQDVIIQKTDSYDGAIPSGNSVMAGNLNYLGRVLDNQSWLEISSEMLEVITDSVKNFPVSYSNWNNILICKANNYKDLIFLGPGSAALRDQFLREYHPEATVQSSEKESDLPLLKDKRLHNFPQIFCCDDFSCSAPVQSLNELKNLLKNNNL